MTFKPPLYLRTVIFLIGLYLIISILYIGRNLFLPLMYAALAASLFSPLVKFMVRRKIGRTVSISLIMVVSLALGIGLIVILISQASMFVEVLPELESQLEELIKQSVLWFSEYFQISTKNIYNWIENSKPDIFDKSTLSNTINSVGDVLSTVVLTPVYIFMLLYYQPHLLQSVHSIFGNKNNNKVSEFLNESKTIIQKYLVGLSIELIIVSILNILGLLILGIDYAIMLGILGGLLNIIPYLGGLIAIVLFALVALLTKSPIYVLYVAGVYALIQIIDNNFIVPKIVGSKVKLNALVSLLVVILGAALWGIPGMFLSIPVTAIFKLLLDRIESLKPWGFLLGESVKHAKEPGNNKIE